MRAQQRIEGYDLARALAIIGMVIVNFKIATGADKHDSTWLLTAMGWLDGRAAATFVVLAGCGLTMLTDRARRQNDAEALARHRVTLLKRAAFLLVIGLAYTPIWPADILHFYGVYIAIGAYLIASSARVLWGGVAIVTLLSLGMLVTLDYERGWNFETLEYSGFWTISGMIRHLFFNGFHPVLPWVAFLFVGIWLARQDMADARVRRRIIAIGLVCWAGTELLSWALIATLTQTVAPNEVEDLRALFGTQPMPPVPLYLVAAGGLAVTIIVSCIEIMQRAGNATWTRPLVFTGQISLTLYVAHVILGMGTLEAMGRLGGQRPGFALSAAVVFSIASVVFATGWRRYFARGPLEWVMRRVTG